MVNGIARTGTTSSFFKNLETYVIASRPIIYEIFVATNIFRATSITRSLLTPVMGDVKLGRQLFPFQEN